MSSTARYDLGSVIGRRLIAFEIISEGFVQRGFTFSGAWILRDSIVRCDGQSQDRDCRANTKKCYQLLHLLSEPPKIISAVAPRALPFLVATGILGCD